MDGVDLVTFPSRRVVDPGFDPDLPRESPTAMPVQALYGPRRKSTGASRTAHIGRRRAMLIGATLAATVAASACTAEALLADGLGPLDVGILAVSGFLFAWTAFWFFTNMAGLMATRGKRPLSIDMKTAAPVLVGRTAILAPVYNEETHTVFARLQAVHESLQASGQGSHFDLFVLSDSTDPAIRVAERRAFDQLRREARRGGGVFYRHRTDNEGRKAGNVAEWVRRFGGAYDSMVVLDADSLMTGDTLVRLAGAMERNPRVGLIQTLPMIVNRQSLLGRSLQFASSLYGPLLARGLSWWSASEGNYWGHNAIIRVRAFAAYAGLPELTGANPFGGAIMSHDFVEAALIRRGGYEVHMAPELRGSFEECPPTLDALLTRDRRWCQGNLQHVRLLNASGLHWVSRLHLTNGALAYLTSPLWLALLAMSVMLPLWPELGQGAGRIADGSGVGSMAVGLVFAVSMALLLAPKLVAYLAAMADPAQRRAHGGPGRAFVSVALETVISALVAPVVMLSQSKVLVDLALGRDSGWGAQARCEGECGLADAAFVWLAPAVVGLVLSIPVAAAIARPDLGAAAKAKGLLLVPEEVRPPDILVRANLLAADYLRPSRVKLLFSEQVAHAQFDSPRFGFVDFTPEATRPLTLTRRAREEAAASTP